MAGNTSATGGGHEESPALPSSGQFKQLLRFRIAESVRAKMLKMNRAGKGELATKACWSGAVICVRKLSRHVARF